MSSKLFKGRYRTSTFRLHGYDYASHGKYFVTICLHGRRPDFGTVTGGHMILSAAGRIAHEYWHTISLLYPQVRLYAWQVMPDHFHGILELVPLPEGASTGRNRFSEISPKAGSLSAIIRSYKSACTITIRNTIDPTFAWQSLFYEHIIRNEREFDRISRYIINNPKNWNKG